MRKIFGLLLLLPLLMICSACKNDQMTIVVRPCVVEGSPWVKPELSPDGRHHLTDSGMGALYDLFERSSEIWNAGADIGFLIAAHGPSGTVPVIPDPIPAGQSDRHNIDGFVDSGKTGDLYQYESIRPTMETELLVAACNQAWTDAFPDSMPGIPVIFISRFVKENGTKAVSLLGFGPPLNPPYGLYDAGVCVRPYQIDPAVVRDRYVIIPTANNYSESQLVPHTLAHELGHALLLHHGDGIDNNGDGRWDLGCDYPGESTLEPAQGYHSLMGAYEASSTTITPLQRELARSAAQFHRGTLGGPP